MSDVRAAETIRWVYRRGRPNLHIPSVTDGPAPGTRWAAATAAEGVARSIGAALRRDTVSASTRV